GENLRIEQSFEGDMRIDARGDDAGLNLRAIFEAYAAGAVAVGADRVDRRLAADVDAEVAARLLQRRRESAHPAADVTPHAARAAGLAQHVMEQHSGGAGRAAAGERADDRVGGEGRFEDLAFEPAFENRPGGAGEDLDRFGQIG